MKYPLGVVVAPFTLALAILGVLASPAHATHTEPTKAKKVTFAFVNGFAPCSAPNSAMQANGFSACAPPIDPFFSFGSAFTATGSGKLTMTFTVDPITGSEDIKLAAAANRLNANCEGENLCLSLGLRLTNGDCPEGSCTAVDLENFKLLGACCQVADGKCKVKTTLLTAQPGFLPQGKNTGIEVLGCGLASEFPLAAEPSLTCGVLFK